MDITELQGAIYEETGLLLDEDAIANIADVMNSGVGAAVPPRRVRAPIARRPARQAGYQGYPGYGAAGYGAGAGSCGVVPVSRAAGPIGQHLPLPFDSVTTVAVGATQNVTSRPQYNFQPSRLIIPNATVGVFFVINDLRIGTRSQFTANVALPAVVFAENAIGTNMLLEPALVSQDVVMNVTNIDVAVHRYLAAMMGESCG